MTEPTDEALENLFVEETGFDIDDFPAAIFGFTRAVLAKWGTPAGAAEPECTCSAKDAPFGTCCKVRSAFERWYDEQNYGRLQPFDVFKGGWIERHRLSSTPQPTRAQAGAVPLTDEQLAEIMRETWGCASIAPRHAMQFARAIERAHDIGIKGGQHG